MTIWQIVIGIWGTITSLFGLLALSNNGVTPLIGTYLCAIGSIALLIGAFNLRNDLKKEPEKKDTVLGQ
jgi:hypothetical protein